MYRKGSADRLESTEVLLSVTKDLDLRGSLGFKVPCNQREEEKE